MTSATRSNLELIVRWPLPPTSGLIWSRMRLRRSRSESCLPFGESVDVADREDRPVLRRASVSSSAPRRAGG